MIELKKIANCATCANFYIDASNLRQYRNGGNLMGICRVMAQKIEALKSDLPLPLISPTDFCAYYCFDPQITNENHERTLT
jgi:hypothetical protein